MSRFRWPDHILPTFTGVLAVCSRFSGVSNSSLAAGRLEIPSTQYSTVENASEHVESWLELLDCRRKDPSVGGVGSLKRSVHEQSSFLRLTFAAPARM